VITIENFGMTGSLKYTCDIAKRSNSCPKLVYIVKGTKSRHGNAETPQGFTQPADIVNLSGPHGGE